MSYVNIRRVEKTTVVFELAESQLNSKEPIRLCGFDTGADRELWLVDGDLMRVLQVAQHLIPDFLERIKAKAAGLKTEPCKPIF